jgi:hypothetical protein
MSKESDGPEQNDQINESQTTEKVKMINVVAQSDEKGN